MSQLSGCRRRERRERHASLVLAIAVALALVTVSGIVLMIKNDGRFTEVVV